MSTTQVTAILFQLQQLDLELDRITAEDQALSASLQGNAQLRHLRAEYEGAQQQWSAAQQAQKEAEWTLDELNHRLQQQEQRLYSGTVNNPKELQSLQQEVQRLRGQQSRQEEHVLEAIDGAEASKEAVQQRDEALQKANVVWQQEARELVSKRENLQVRRQDLLEKRVVLVGRVSENLLKRYETLRRTKQGRAVSKVDQNSCQWCRVILTPSELQHVRISSELQLCTNCGRILYYER